VVEAGIKAVYACTLTPRKATTSPHAGGMVESSSSHLELRSAFNGIFIPNASQTIVLQITSAPFVPLRTIPSSPANVSNYNKIVTPLSAEGFDTLLHHHNLTSYPNLSWNLCNGFPLGEFVYLHESFNHPNHSNSNSVNDYILNYMSISEPLYMIMTLINIVLSFPRSF
jgi:hypothetical protein